MQSDNLGFSYKRQGLAFPVADAAIKPVHIAQAGSAKLLTGSAGGLTDVAYHYNGAGRVLFQWADMFGQLGVGNIFATADMAGTEFVGIADIQNESVVAIYQLCQALRANGFAATGRLVDEKGDGKGDQAATQDVVVDQEFEKTVHEGYKRLWKTGGQYNPLAGYAVGRCRF